MQQVYLVEYLPDEDGIAEYAGVFLSMDAAKKGALAYLAKVHGSLMEQITSPTMLKISGEITFHEVTLYDE